MACSTFNEGECNVSKSRIRPVTVYSGDFLGGGSIEDFNFPSVCLQCEEPFCVKVCPAGALAKNKESGIVESKRERCVGCKLCSMICPIGGINFVEGLVAKCNLCGGDPKCVKFCEKGAITYGELDNVSAPRQKGLAKIIWESTKVLKEQQKVPVVGWPLRKEG
jgi:Fe-S-cluster-containing dehydrogenase component